MPTLSPWPMPTPGPLRARRQTRAQWPNRAQRGGALLAVLWLTAALGAIAFAVAINVRGEIDRSSTLSEGLRAQYLAEGAVNRGILHILWGPGERKADGTPRFFEQGLSGELMDFPSGVAITEYISDSSRLNINDAPIADIERLLLALGAAPGQAQEIAAAIVEWRTPAPPGATGMFDQYYLTRVPSFRARHASIEEIEELLYVKGMTPELFYGTYRRDNNGRLVRMGGLRDCVSPKGAVGVYDVNGVEPALLLSIGAPPAAVEEIMRLRASRPLRMQDLQTLRTMAGPAAQRLRAGGYTRYTIRSTARLRLPDGRMSDVRRTASATVKYFVDGQSTKPYEILRFDTNSSSEAAQWN